MLSQTNQLLEAALASAKTEEGDPLGIRFSPGWSGPQKAAWLRQGRNFACGRKTVLRTAGLGLKSWRAYLAQYGLGESYQPCSLADAE